MLRCQHWTERIVAVAIAIVIVEVEQTSIGIIVIASTFEERIACIRKVRIDATV